VDIGTPGLGGPNSFAFGVNEQGEAIGSAQTSNPDPDTPAEDFCGFNALGLTPSNSTCLPYLWHNGAMHPLPTLGGPNGFAWMINNQGETVGLVETGTQYGGCPVHQFVPTVWKHGQPTALHTPGELYGVAAYINDKGQVVGASGSCTSFNPYSDLYLSEEYAMLWDEDGTPHELPSLGGTPSQGGPAALAGNHACGINNRGQAVGHSELSNGTTFHAVLWPNVNSNLDLGTLPAPLNYASLVLGINDRSQVVGASLDSTQTISRAFIWQNGVMTDLNQLVKGSSSLTLALAESINNRGEIIGNGLTSTGEIHGFLAIPSDDR
jgi:probable HAF family extracellular repeat protein